MLDRHLGAQKGSITCTYLHKHNQCSSNTTCKILQLCYEFGLKPKYLHSLGTSAPNWCELLHSHPGPLTPGRRATGIHWAGVLVGPRAGLDALQHSKVSYPCHELNHAYSTSVGRDSSVGITDSLRAEWPWDRIPVGGKDWFSAPVQTSPGAHPAAYTMGIGSSPRIRRPGRGVNQPPPPFTEIKERVELYLYSPLVPEWYVLGRNLTLPSSIIQPVV